MFIGHINTKIDAKGRVVVPALFRKGLDGKTAFYARMNAGQEYLKVYTEEEWNRLYESLMSKIDEWSDKDNKKLMHWMDEAIFLEIDVQGRLLIPKEQKDRMQVKDELSFVGMGKNFAIWDSQRYDDYVNNRGEFSING